MMAYDVINDVTLCRILRKSLKSSNLFCLNHTIYRFYRYFPANDWFFLVYLRYLASLYTIMMVYNAIINAILFGILLKWLKSSILFAWTTTIYRFDRFSPQIMFIFCLVYLSIYTSLYMCMTVYDTINDVILCRILIKWLKSAFFTWIIKIYRFDRCSP